MPLQPVRDNAMIPGVPRSKRARRASTSDDEYTCVDGARQRRAKHKYADEMHRLRERMRELLGVRKRRPTIIGPRLHGDVSLILRSLDAITGNTNELDDSPPIEQTYTTQLNAAIVIVCRALDLPARPRHDTLRELVQRLEDKKLRDSHHPS